MTSVLTGFAADVLFRQDRVPVHSCELFTSPAAARACPTGTIELVVETGAGLISNRRFEPDTQTFSGRYEETQAFSGHFSAYARDLAERLIAVHDLGGKRIVEVGCGKGYFLIELCRMADATGIGIDPCVAPGRFAELSDVDVTFLAERLAPRHADLAPDLVICRHTLEHTADPVSFLHHVNRLVGRRRGVPFYLDVPDATRILREGAFWDIYYEHCHYFTPASLAAVLTAAGFAIADIHREYDDQFLCATAFSAPSAAPTAGPTDIHPEHTTDATQTFRSAAQAQIDAWSTWFAERASQKVAIWGAGSKAVAFLTTLNLRHQVSHAVDINPHKSGAFIPGTAQPIVAPSALADIRPEHVVIMNPVYAGEIAADVRSIGLSATLWTVGELPIRPLPAA
jgi:SAM-dependent methyltransferase